MHLFGSVLTINCIEESSSCKLKITLNYYYPEIQDIAPWLPASQRKMAEKNFKKVISNVSSKARYSYIMPLFWRK